MTPAKNPKSEMTVDIVEELKALHEAESPEDYSKLPSYQEFQNTLRDAGIHFTKHPLNLSTFACAMIWTMCYAMVFGPIIILISPYLLLTAILQCFVDVNFWRGPSAIVSGWTKGVANIQNPSKPPRSPDLGSADYYAKNTFYSTLSWSERSEYQDRAKKIGYDPDTDVDASHLLKLFKPETFTIEEDDAQYDACRNRWIYMAQQSCMAKEMTKSLWDYYGHMCISAIYIKPYSVNKAITLVHNESFTTTGKHIAKTLAATGSEIPIHDSNEHKWLRECWSIAFYEIEYYLGLLVKAHSANPDLVENREFVFRYELLNDMLNMKKLVNSSANLTSVVVQRSIQAKAAALPDLGDIIIGFKKAKLFTDRCEYYDRMNKQSKL